MYFNLDRKISIQWLIATKNAGGFGDDAEVWEELFSPMANRKDLSKDRSAERIVNDLIEVSTSYCEFTVRFNVGRRLLSDEYKPYISTNMRIVDEYGYIWDIENVSEPPNTRRQYLLLRCKQRGER